MQHLNQDLLKTISTIESEIDDSLADKIISKLIFSHITGSPDDKMDSSESSCDKLI